MVLYFKEEKLSSYTQKLSFLCYLICVVLFWRRCTVWCIQFSQKCPDCYWKCLHLYIQRLYVCNNTM